MASFSIAAFFTRQKTEGQTKVLDEVKINEINEGKDLFLSRNVYSEHKLNVSF